MNPIHERIQHETRRHFLKSSSLSLGAVAFSHLLQRTTPAAELSDDDVLARARCIAPKARRVIYLFQSGGPSQLDLYDHKPGLQKLSGENLPASVRGTQRLTGFTNKQKELPVTPTKYRFVPHGESGLHLTELLPNLGRVADDICLIHSMTSDAINHDPARTLFQTGATLAGRPSMGAWVSYGLGSECEDLPSFMVLTSIGSCKRVPQPVTGRLWESGFLPSQFQA